MIRLSLPRYLTFFFEIFSLRSLGKSLEMDRDSLIHSALKRIDLAERQIKLLKHEIKDIKLCLNSVIDNENSTSATDHLRQQNLRHIVKSENVLDESDGQSSAKRTRYDFDTNGEYVIVFTDGACANNGFKGSKAGIGVWWADNHPLNVSKPAIKRNTNNAAEIQACTEACKIAAENDIKKLLIKTDSEFVIKCMTQWINRWKKNNWKTAAKKDVINKEDLMDLEKQCKLLDDVQYEHIKGHAGIHGNEEADKLAVRGAQLK